MNTGDKGSSFERTYEILVGQTPEFPRGYIPFASDSSGDLFMYSLKPESFGNIMFNQEEYYGDEDRFVLFLAPTLREFINSLTEEPDVL